jgi:phosphatidylglycerophosphate synthase
VGVLDGVDGKLARLRLEFSEFGELEHWLDFLYEWSWWAALAYFFANSELLPNAWLYFGLLALFELVDGAAKLLNIRCFGRLIDEMSPIEGFVRIFGGRRNIYIWLMVIGTLMGKPESAYKLLPIWQGCTALLHWIRLPWLFATRPTRLPMKGGDA